MELDMDKVTKALKKLVMEDVEDAVEADEVHVIILLYYFVYDVILTMIITFGAFMTCFLQCYPYNRPIMTLFLIENQW